MAHPIAVIAGLSPSSAALGGESFTLTIAGRNFINGMQVLVQTPSLQEAARTPTVESPTRLTVGVAASEIATGPALGFRIKMPNGDLSASASLPSVSRRRASRRSTPPAAPSA